MTDCYTEYVNFVKTLVEKGDLTGFKSNPRYTYMLEHVDEKLGFEYVYHIITRFPCSKEDIVTYCKTNDEHGNPEKYNFFGEKISPSSLRYFLHAMLILTYFDSKTSVPIRIVEVGGGYGGLCLAINYCLKFFPNLKVSSYTIVDLLEPSKLQEMYLSRFSLSYKCEFLDAKNFGAEIPEEGDPLFFISNYCLGEIAVHLQEKYSQILLPKTRHGFITWNSPLRDIRKVITYEEEFPKTGPHNLYIRF